MPPHAFLQESSRLTDESSRLTDESSCLTDAKHAYDQAIRIRPDFAPIAESNLASVLYLGGEDLPMRGHSGVPLRVEAGAELSG